MCGCKLLSTVNLQRRVIVILPCRNSCQEDFPRFIYRRNFPRHNELQSPELLDVLAAPKSNNSFVRSDRIYAVFIHAVFPGIQPDGPDESGYTRRGHRLRVCDAVVSSQLSVVSFQLWPDSNAGDS